MHPEYRKILNFYLINHSKSWCYVIKCYLNKLPPPEDITEDWILDFFSKYEGWSHSQNKPDAELSRVGTKLSPFQTEGYRNLITMLKYPSIKDCPCLPLRYQIL